MLSIQPRFTQRLNSQLSFRGDYDYNSYDDNENGTGLTEQDKDLLNLKEDLSSLNHGLQKYEDKVQKLKPVTKALCLVGSGALMGVGTKLGWNETGRLLKKVLANNSVVKFKSRLGKLGEKIATGFKNFRDEKFAKTPVGEAVLAVFKKIGETKPVMFIKNNLSKLKKVKPEAISDTTGDIVAFSTGVSTTIVGAMPEKEKKKIKDISEDIDFNNNYSNEADYDYNDEY